MLRNYIVELVLLEIVIAIALLFVFFHFRNKKSRQIGGSVDDSSMEAVKSEKNYIDYIIEQKNCAQQLLEEVLESETKNDLQEIQRRVQFLEAEEMSLRNAENSKNEFWPSIIKIYHKLFFNNSGTDLATVASPESSELEQAKQQLNALNQRLQNYSAKNLNLEKFRALFYEMQDTNEEIQHLNKQLTREISQVTTDKEHIKKLEDLMSATEGHRKNLERRNQVLENELSILAEKLSDIPDKTSAKNTVVFHQEFKDSKSGNQSILLQKMEISELAQVVRELELEVREKDAMLKKMRSIENHANEIESVVFILEDENDFLRSQIEALLRLDQKENNNENIEDLKNQLETKHKEYENLEEQFLQLENRFLKIISNK